MFRLFVTRFPMRLTARSFSNWMLLWLAVGSPAVKSTFAATPPTMPPPPPTRQPTCTAVQRMSSRSRKLSLACSLWRSLLLCASIGSHLRKWKWNFFGPFLPVPCANKLVCLKSSINSGVFWCCQAHRNQASMLQPLSTTHQHNPHTPPIPSIYQPHHHPRISPQYAALSSCCRCRCFFIMC